MDRTGRFKFLLRALFSAALMLWIAVPVVRADSSGGSAKSTSQSTVDTLEMITDRMQSLSRSLEKMPQPPRVTDQIIELPLWGEANYPEEKEDSE